MNPIKHRISLVITIIIGLLFSTKTYANEDFEFKFNYYGGYRIDNLQWTIAGIDNNPNILSELIFENLNIIQGKIQVTKKLTPQMYFNGDLNLGLIIKGSNQDSDYLGNDRTQEFSRSNNDCNGNAVFDISGALGWHLLNTDVILTGLIGYAINGQNLLITNGYQTLYIDPDTGAVGEPGPINDLNTTYKAFWNGLWIGFRLESKSKQKLFCEYEYHIIDYYGEGNWNLRSDFAHPKSFSHEASGHGQVISLGTTFLNNQYQFIICFNLGNWETNSGTDKTYFSDGTTIKTKFNGANWDTKSLMISFKYLL